jgi:hypothetical protein
MYKNLFKEKIDNESWDCLEFEGVLGGEVVKIMLIKENNHYLICLGDSFLLGSQDLPYILELFERIFVGFAGKDGNRLKIKQKNQ